MAKQLAMLIDSSKCIDCKACVLSCKTAHQLPENVYRNWIKEAETDFSLPNPKVHFQPGACMHCSEPTCVSACPTGAAYRNTETGEVGINQQLCIGCGNCIEACPYHARYINKNTRTAEKCDYCAYRRAQGLDPACVSCCPTKVRTFGDINDSASEAGKMFKEGKWVSVENKETPTKPNMYYLNSTSPDNWTSPAKEPASMTTLTNIFSPLVRIAVGVSAIGVAAAFIRELVAPDSEEDNKEEATQDKKEKEEKHEDPKTS